MFHLNRCYTTVKVNENGIATHIDQIRQYYLCAYFFNNITYIIDIIYIIDTDQEKFDGVAVNNEAYAAIKCSSDLNQRTTYLDRLQEIHDGAQKQRHGRLLTHFSVSWHWGQCNGQSQPFLWRGKTSDASHHMIDIFDSIDVQVNWFNVDLVSR